MDFIEGLVKFVIMMIAIGIAMGLLAWLFIIIFNIATGVDDRLRD